MNRCGLTSHSAPTGFLFDRPTCTPSSTPLIFVSPPEPLLAFGWFSTNTRAAPDNGNFGGSGGGGRLRRVPIKGDGRCLYRAISQGIAYEDGRNLSQRWETEDADALRLLAFNIICKQKRGEYKTNMVIEGNVDRYCSRMLSPKFFAGEVEMKELADALKRPIAVFIQQGGAGYRNIVTYGEKWGQSRKRNPVKLLYNGQNHFDLLIQA